MTLNHILHLNRCKIFLKLTNNSELKPSDSLTEKMTVKKHDFQCQNDCILKDNMKIIFDRRINHKIREKLHMHVLKYSQVLKVVYISNVIKIIISTKLKIN